MKKLLTVIVALMVAMLPVLAFAAEKTNKKVTITAGSAIEGFEMLSKLKIEASLDRGENPAIAADILFDGKSLINFRIWPSKDFKTLYSQCNLFGDMIFSVDLEDALALVAAAATAFEDQLGGINIAAYLSEEALAADFKNLFTETEAEAKASEKVEGDLLSTLVSSVDLSKLDFNPILKSIEELAAKATIEDAKDLTVEFSTDKLGVDDEHKIEIKVPVAKIGKLVIEKSDITAIIASVIDVVNKVVNIVDTKQVIALVDEFLKKVDLNDIELLTYADKDGNLAGIEAKINGGEGENAGTLDTDFVCTIDAAAKVAKYAFQLNVASLGKEHTENSIPVATIAASLSTDENAPQNGFIIFGLGNAQFGQLVITAGQKSAADKDTATVLGVVITSAEGKKAFSGSLAIAEKENGSFEIVLTVDGKEFGRLDAKVEAVDSVPNPDAKDAIAVLKLSAEEKAALEQQIIQSATGAFFGALGSLSAA